jgi:hypothetical protein
MYGRMGLGSGDNGQFTFLDTIGLLSFAISMMNYGENITQSDKQDLQQDLTDKINLVLNEIHGHLQEQDEKIDRIMEELNK